MALRIATYSSCVSHLGGGPGRDDGYARRELLVFKDNPNYKDNVCSCPARTVSTRPSFRILPLNLREKAHGSQKARWGRVVDKLVYGLCLVAAVGGSASAGVLFCCNTSHPQHLSLFSYRNPLNLGYSAPSLKGSG